jgi:hypothetical protein
MFTVVVFTSIKQRILAALIHRKRCYSNGRLEVFISGYEINYVADIVTSYSRKTMGICKYYVFGHYASSCLYLKTVMFIFKTKRFGDWILSPSSGKTYSIGSNR